MMLIKRLPSLNLMGICLARLALAYPSAEGSSDSNLLFKRAGTTAQLGDYTGSTSSYPDGSGTYVDSKDQGTYASGVKCWTDIFYVTNEYQAQAWTPMKENTIDCALTSTCASSSQDAVQNCGSWSITWGNEIEVDIIEKIGLELQENIDNTWLKSKCVTATVLNTCTWDDKLCHALWTSSVVQVFDGYIRRRCSGGRSGITSQPDYTAWSKDYSWTQPSPQTRLGCGALCDETTYPEPVPSVGST
ncbi:hypothetical protein HO173_013358 [Letharia columbiana]|nr:uncharacterized protein HO173_013358 [Letharia columbiana]KAF6222549.1 hypothetical protein HO173_013358 [Letharia columbiana]